MTLLVNKYFPFIFLYFFLNSEGLEHGLLYTTIMAPLFYFWLIGRGKRLVIFTYFAMTLPFIVAHYINGVDLYYYLRSYALLFMIYITVYAAAEMLTCMRSPGILFNRIIILNFIFASLALLILNTSYSEPIWTHDIITSGADQVSRLRLFTYEPSYYSTLMVPFVALSISRLIDSRSAQNYMMLIISLVPMVLAFSFGVISSFMLAIGITVLWKRRLMMKKLYAPLLITFAIGGIVFLYSGADNVLLLRISNVISGVDSSGYTRTIESNLLAYRIAQSKSVWWGAGFGQSKLFLSALTGLDWYRITNAVASTFDTLGMVGLISRFALEFYLFFKMRVSSSYYRLMLFCFVFIYQFTGSYVTNLAEYIIWTLAFIPVFIEFEEVKRWYWFGANRGFEVRGKLPKAAS